MQLPRVRVRTLMIAVAIVAVQCVVLRANSLAVMDYYGRSWAIVIIVHSACVIMLYIVAWRAWMSTSRFRIWTVMTALAVAVILVPAPEVVRRWQIARMWVHHFQWQENRNRTIASYWKKLGDLYANPPKGDAERLRREAEVDTLWRRSGLPRSSFQSPAEIDKAGVRMITWLAREEAGKSTAQADWCRSKREKWNRAAFHCFWEELPTHH